MIDPNVPYRIQRIYSSSTEREKAYLNVNSPNHRECPGYFISKYTGDTSSIRGFPGGSAVKNPPTMQEMQETRVRSLGQEDPLEEGTASHSSILAWRIPWKEEPGAPQSIGSQSMGRN